MLTSPRSPLPTLVSLPQPNDSNPLKTRPDEASVVVRCRLTDQTLFSATASFRSAPPPAPLWNLPCPVPLFLEESRIGVPIEAFLQVSWTRRESEGARDRRGRAGGA